MDINFGWAKQCNMIADVSGEDIVEQPTKLVGPYIDLESMIFDVLEEVRGIKKDGDRQLTRVCWFENGLTIYYTNKADGRTYSIEYFVLNDGK